MVLFSEPPQAEEPCKSFRLQPQRIIVSHFPKRSPSNSFTQCTQIEPFPKPLLRATIWHMQRERSTQSPSRVCKRVDTWNFPNASGRLPKKKHCRVVVFIPKKARHSQLPLLANSIGDSEAMSCTVFSLFVAEKGCSHLFETDARKSRIKVLT